MSLLLSLLCTHISAYGSYITVCRVKQIIRVNDDTVALVVMFKLI